MSEAPDPQRLNDQVLEAARAVHTATDLSGELVRQAVAQSAATAIQDAAARLRQVSDIGTAACGAALAKYIATGEPRWADTIEEAQRMIDRAAGAYRDIGETVAAMLQSVGSPAAVAAGAAPGLYVADRRICAPEDLSEAARFGLSHVAGGEAWLQAAIASSADAYAFPDEFQLVAAAQQGLHGEPCAYSDLGLMVSPARLMTLHDELNNAENGPNEVLDRHGLKRVQALAEAEAILARLGVADLPAFHALSLDDRICLTRLVPPRGALGAEAAGFAAREAKSPQAFVDLFDIYVALAGKGAPRDPVRRHERAVQALTELTPVLAGRMAAPRIGGFAVPDDIKRLLQAWLASHPSLGFHRLSGALRAIIVEGGYRPASGTDPADAVDAYLSAASACLAAAEIATPQLSQDAASCEMVASGPGGEARLRLGADGTLSMLNFKPAPSEASK